MKCLAIVVTLTLVLLTATGHAQQLASSVGTPAPPDALECHELTGRITDPFAYPLTGATIMLRSPDKSFNPEAYSTNSEGHFIITVKHAIPRNTILEVIAVGYITLELSLTNCRPLDLTLTPVESTNYKAKSRSKKPKSSGKVR